VRDYYALQIVEEAATAAASETFFGTRTRQLTIFLPSAVLLRTQK